MESELDRGYQFVRRRKAGGLRRKASALDTSVAGQSAEKVRERRESAAGEGVKERKKGERGRAASAGAGVWKMGKDGEK